MSVGSGTQGDIKYASVSTADLLARIELAESAIENVDVKIALAGRYYDLSRERRAELCQSALAYKGEIDVPGYSRRSILQNCLGVIELQKGNPQVAFGLLQKAMLTARDRRDISREISARNNLTIALARIGGKEAEIEKHFSWLLENLEYSTPESRVATRAGHGKFLLDQHRIFAGIAELEKAQTEAIQLKKPHHAMISTLMLMTEGIRMGAYVDSQKWLRRLDSIKSILPNDERKRILECLGWIVESKLSKDSNAISELQKIYDATDPREVTPFFESIFLRTKAEVFISTGRFDEALQVAQQSLSCLDSLDLKSQFDSAVVVAKASVEVADFQTFDSIISKYQPVLKNRPKIAQQLKRLAERKQNDIDKLAAVKQRQRSEMWMILSSAMALLVLSTAATWFFFQRRHQRLILEKRQTLNVELTHLLEERTAELNDEFQQKRQLAKRLAEKEHLETLGGFVGNVAHDFNNLLQVIRTSNELLEPHCDVSEIDLLKSSNQCVEIAQSTISQLLAYSKTQRLEATNVDFSEYLDRHQGVFRSSLPETVRFEINDDSKGGIIFADESQLTMCILNLLSNGNDAITTTGCIELTTRIREIDDEGPEAELPGGTYLEIVVSDDGVGMTNQVAEQAIRPFFSTKREGAGTGLGLSSVDGFVRQSGGEIRIDSRPGFGTKVAMRFPILDAKNSVATRSDDQLVPVNLAGFSVLVVEDNPLVAQSVVMVLETSGASAFHVDRASEAISILSKRCDFNHVLSDISMPGSINGVGLADWIEKNRPGLAFTLVSGNAIAAESLEIPVLRKPYTRSELLMAITRTRFSKTG